MRTAGPRIDPGLAATEGVAGKVQEESTVIYNTAKLIASDPEALVAALETFRKSLEEAGGTDIRVYRNVDRPKEVLTGMLWPNIESCHKYAADHAQDFETVLGPHMTGGEPEDLWEEVR
jgi:hypothetical protein